MSQYLRGLDGAVAHASALNVNAPLGGGQSAAVGGVVFHAEGPDFAPEVGDGIGLGDGDVDARGLASAIAVD